VHLVQHFIKLPAGTTTIVPSPNRTAWFLGRDRLAITTWPILPWNGMIAARDFR
jgi:hypothetical protein